MVDLDQRINGDKSLSRHAVGFDTGSLSCYTTQEVDSKLGHHHSRDHCWLLSQESIRHRQDG